MKRRKFLSNLILGCLGLPLFGITKKQTDHDKFLELARHAQDYHLKLFPTSHLIGIMHKNRYFN